MSHLRTQIRAALGVALTGLASTGTRVHINRVRPVSVAAGPVLGITIARETVTELGLDPIQQRDLSIEINGYCAAAPAPDDTLDQIGLADLEGIGLDHGQPPGTIVELCEEGQEPRVLLDQHHLAGVAFQQGAGQPAGTGADLDHGPALERPCQPDDLPGDVQIQQKMLAEALLRQQAVGVEGFAKGGEVGGVHRCVIAGRSG